MLSRSHTVSTGPPRSLEDHRRVLCLSVDEFAQQIGVSTATYYRLIRKEDVHPRTKRKVAEALHTPPILIAEFFPEMSTEFLSAIDASIARADKEGYVEVDLDALVSTGEIVVRSGE